MCGSRGSRPNERRLPGLGLRWRSWSTVRCCWLRHFAGGVGAVHLAIAALACVIAGMIVSIGRIRAREMRTGGDTPPGPTPLLVVVLGASLAAFGVVVTAGALWV